MGVGKIKIKTVDDAMYTLKDITYVVKMKKNMISWNLLNDPEKKIHQRFYHLKGNRIKTSKVKTHTKGYIQ